MASDNLGLFPPLISGIAYLFPPPPPWDTSFITARCMCAWKSCSIWDSGGGPEGNPKLGNFSFLFFWARSAFHFLSASEAWQWSPQDSHGATTSHTKQ